MMNKGVAVSVDNLVVERGGKVVLPGLTLSITEGCVTGLLGPSGGGKSTLIRSIAGIQMIRSGSVTALGSPAGSVLNRSRVGYMTQGNTVYADLTVSENVAYFARLAGKDSAAVADALRAVELTDKAKALTGNLSGGQHARVSLAAVLVTDPELYLLDEPTVGLDPVLRRDLWELFASLAARGKTLLVSSHVMDEAARCDDVLLLRDGRLIAQDTPDGLRARSGHTDLDEAFLTLALAGGDQS